MVFCVLRLSLLDDFCFDTCCVSVFVWQAKLLLRVHWVLRACVWVLCFVSGFVVLLCLSALLRGFRGLFSNELLASYWSVGVRTVSPAP